MTSQVEEKKISNNDVFQEDRNYVFHSWSVQGALKPLVIESGSGSYVWDHDGKRYLDFSSQLVNTNLGHQHPKVIEAIKEQADTLTTIAPATANATRNAAARKVVELAPASFKKVFFTNGGADANENAIRMARLYTGRDKVLSSYRSYHGNTGAAIVATGDPRRVPNEYAHGHAHFFSPYLYRSEFWSESETQECERALTHLRHVIESEGAANIAAILLESVPGTAGILVPPQGYMEGVRALCDEFGIVMIMDEVMAGFGRTGKWFAFEHYDITPDLITFAKGVNSGYVPAGGVLISDKICEYFNDKMFPGGLTYSGHPLAMASIVATIDAMQEEGIVDNAARIGKEVLAPGLQALKDKHACVGDVRGVGVFWAIELVNNNNTKEKFSAEQMNAIKAACLDKGLLPFLADNRIHVVPPCSVSQEDAERGLAILDEVLSSI